METNLWIWDMNQKTKKGRFPMLTFGWCVTVCRPLTTCFATQAWCLTVAAV